MKTALIGFGNVGRQLWESLREHSKLPLPEIIVTSKYVLNRDLKRIGTASDYGAFIQNACLAYLAIPSDYAGKGENEFSYVERLLNNGTRVVTCAKGFPSNFPSFVLNHERLLGISATVGCLTQMPLFIRDIKRDTSDNIQSGNAILNGTLNYLWHEMSKGSSTELALHYALGKGLTEPGRQDLESVVKSEIEDSKMKSSIVLHQAFYPCDSPVRPNEFIDSKDASILIGRAIDHPSKFRFAVSFGRKKSKLLPFEPVFSGENEKYHLKAGFCNVKDLPPEMNLNGENNVLFLSDDKTTFRTYAVPGAGWRYTASVMIGDALSLLRR